MENLVEVSDELREDISTIAFDLQDLRRWVHYKYASIYFLITKPFGNERLDAHSMNN